MYSQLGLAHLGVSLLVFIFQIAIVTRDNADNNGQ